MVSVLRNLFDNVNSQVEDPKDEHGYTTTPSLSRIFIYKNLFTYFITNLIISNQLYLKIQFIFKNSN